MQWTFTTITVELAFLVVSIVAVIQALKRFAA